MTPKNQATELKVMPGGLAHEKWSGEKKNQIKSEFHFLNAALVTLREKEKEKLSLGKFR